MGQPSPKEREFVEWLGLFFEMFGTSRMMVRMRCSGAAARKADSDPPR